MTLHPGDILATGIPPGADLGIKPEAAFLRAGIDGRGEQRLSVVSAA